MPELIAKTALAGQSITIGTVTLAETAVGQITSIAVFPGQMKPAATALGQPFPKPNTFSTKSGILCWTGPDQAFLIGSPAPDLTGIAATTDQSGGWAALRVTGTQATDALMRLVPLDLRAFKPGQSARTPLGHMQMVLMREKQGFLLLVFRSMARTAWHEVETAMKSLAARAAL